MKNETNGLLDPGREIDLSQASWDTLGHYSQQSQTISKWILEIGRHVSKVEVKLICLFPCGVYIAGYRK